MADIIQQLGGFSGILKQRYRDMGDGTYVLVQEAQPPANLLTDGATGQSRLMVEDGSTGFYEGRQFRIFVELNIPAGGTRWIRITKPVNFELHEQRISLVSGSIRWSAVAGTATSPGPWTPLTFRPRNQMTSRPLPIYVSGAVIESSNLTDAVTGGIDVDLMIVSAEGQGNSNIPATQNAGVRGLPPGVFHVKMVNNSTEAAVGVYDWWWEEKP